ncbi:MAG: LysR substrate-binding domain-containing protein [Sagittula sp.]|uniref:LysR substrate-binding domain-containing protein n=1 Tax=unclassified Sagittula TaxID=2624628 RepID=UPI000C2CF46C|nr:LysR substrate-binding domain-containing protein [Sagittula sp. P11]AUC53166.1 LysR family transcriptional regulator [Sagittula sp. P11]
MGRKFPPFAAVRAFEAAARHLSFKAAAEELCLTPSAVSHQIKALEAFLDTALFERTGGRISLTLTGRGYAGKMTGLLDAFEDSTRSVKEAGARPFRVLCTPGFAARWLVPRLDRLGFGDRVRLRVSVGAPSTDFAANDSDLVIQWADDPVPGVVTEPFMTSARYPVISPALREREDVRVPSDLLRLRLMHDEVLDAWDEWFDAAGVAPRALPRGPVFPNCELATTAAEQGQGVALAYDMMVRGTLEAGRLERLFDTVTLPVTIYSVAYPEARADDPMIRSFRDWVFAEMERDGAPLLARPAAE